MLVDGNLVTLEHLISTYTSTKMYHKRHYDDHYETSVCTDLRANIKNMNYKKKPFSSFFYVIVFKI